jgi:phospholipid transport system substrate-binding protein
MKKWMLAAVFGLLSFGQLAQAGEATNLLQSAQQEILDEFNAKRSLFEQDKSQLYAFVDAKLSKYFDFLRIGRFVLARHWRTAPDAQKIAFIKAFREMLIRTYSSAMFKYTGQAIRYTREQDLGNNQVMVGAEMDNAAGGAPFQAEFRMLKTPEGWKIIAVKLEGIDVLINFRNEYDQTITAKGLPALIKELEGKNASPEAVAS